MSSSALMEYRSQDYLYAGTKCIFKANKKKGGTRTKKSYPVSSVSNREENSNCEYSRAFTFFRALDVLRSGQNTSSLVVCRVDSMDRDSGATDRKISIGRSFSHAGVLSAGASEHLDNDNTNSSHHISNYGEFSVTLTKVNGSLGFTLTRSESAPILEDGTRLRHSVKALGCCSIGH